jgi:fatty-acyl-CoA synthase
MTTHDGVIAHDTFAARLDSLAQRHGLIALIDNDQRITVRALRDHTLRLAAGLARAGVRPGDRVALWLPNGLEWVASFLACAHLGALVLAVNTRFRSSEVADLLGRGRANWLVYWPGFKGIAFDAILADIPAAALQPLRGVFRAGDTPAPVPVPGVAHAATHSLGALLHGETEAPPAASNGGAICFTTSGTTSLPKFVLHDQRTLLRHGDQVAQVYAFDDSTCILATAPFCGVFGFAALASGLARGVPVVCDAVFDSLRAADAVQRHRVTHSYLNNEALLRMLEAGPAHDFSSSRIFGFASFAPGLDQLPQMALERGIALAGLYGSSELIALVAGQPAADPTRRYLPGGRLIYDEGRVRARDPASGQVLPHGESGEIEIRSPSLMLGYLDDAQATARAMAADGYFRTGDLGYTVNQRQFVFQARIGDSLRLSGFLVNPAEIEHFITALNGVRACQVVGVDVHGKTVPFAFVLLESGASPDPAAWRAQCRNALAAYKVPAAFQVLDEFPSVESANSVKIQKHRLREMATGILQAGSPVI